MKLLLHLRRPSSVLHAECKVTGRSSKLCTKASPKRTSFAIHPKADMPGRQKASPKRTSFAIHPKAALPDRQRKRESPLLGIPGYNVVPNLVPSLAPATGTNMIAIHKKNCMHVHTRYPLVLLKILIRACVPRYAILLLLLLDYPDIPDEILRPRRKTSKVLCSGGKMEHKICEVQNLG